jgi:propanediol dehydratase small subunit
MLDCTVINLSDVTVVRHLGDATMDTSSKERPAAGGLQRHLPGAGWRPLPGTAVTKRTSFSLPPDTPLQEWSRIGRQLNALSASSAWWLGDWLIYGQVQYPDRYKQAVEETSLDYQTLRNYAWVARRYPVGRRRAELSFQHHAELASMPADEQDQWLDRAEKFGWSRNDLRNRVRASRRADRDDVVKADRILKVQMSVPPSQKERWMQASATESEQDFQAWMVAVLDNAAAALLGTAQKRIQPG